MNPGNIVNSLLCPNCQASNLLDARTCSHCKASLAVVRAQYYLDLADADVTATHYEQASSNLTQADVEMIGINSDERRQKLLTARAFWLQGLIYYHKGRISDSCTVLQLALHNLEGISGGEGLMAKVLNRLGNAALYERNPDAISYYQRSTEVARMSGDYSTAAMAMSNLGLLYTMEGPTEQAFVWLERAVEMAERSGDMTRLGGTYRMIASLYAEVGPYSYALAYIAKALALCDRISDTTALCRIYYNAGEVYLFYNDLEQAEQWLLQSDELATRSDYKLLHRSNLITLSALMRAKGEYDAALSYASRAYNQLNLDPTSHSEAITELVLYNIDMGAWTHASRYIQRLEELGASISNQDNLYRARTLLYAAQGQWNEAEQSFAEAKILAHRQHKTYRITNLQEEYAVRLLASIGARHNPIIQARAHALLNEAATTYQQMEMPLRYARIATLLGETPPQDAG